MKNNQGFMLIETAVVFMLSVVLLACVVYGYGICLRTQERNSEAWQAFLLAERFAAGQAVNLPKGWQIVEQQNVGRNLLVQEVQIVAGSRVIANVVQAK